MDGRIESAFLARAAERPDATALAGAVTTVSYGRLEALSGHYAALVQEQGTGVVGILAERGPAVVVAALACARAGRPFAILDLGYPPARLDALIGICRPGLLLAAGRPGVGQAFNLPQIGIDLDVADPRPAPAPAGSPDEAAYLLFTSGSTGAPKCVAVSHRPLVHFVDWQARTFGLTAADRFTMLSGLSHDPVLRDMFTPLSLGAVLHIPAQATLTEPGALPAWFAETRATAAHMTPQLGHLLTVLGAKGPRLPDLRCVFFGGDMLRGPLVRALAAVAPNAVSVNFYGSTETPQAAAFYCARPDEAVSPVGHGIDGFTLEVVDEQGAPVTPGESGEIVVCSAFLTLGYVADGRLPVGPAAMAYKTGDIGYARPDGQVVVQGRRDDQVKIRGYRVEMAEVTAAALAHPGVDQAVTLNIGEPGAARLGLFVQGRTDVNALKVHLTARLPAYMVPDVVTPLERLPLLPNGKVDRQALIASQKPAGSPVRDGQAALSPLEAALVGQWSGIFRGAAVGPDSSFAALGGDSLSYVNAYLSVEAALGEVPPGWTTLSIRELAALKAAKPPGLFTRIESAMALRAAAICTVVASHFGLVFSGGAATSTLFFISGYLFGGLQLHEMDRQPGLAPIARLLRSIVLPLFAVTLPFIALKALMGEPPMLSSFVLNVDLMDFTGIPTEGPHAHGGHDYLMWYIHCALHILLIFTGLLLVTQTWLKLRNAVAVAAVAAVGVGLAGRFVLPAFFLPSFFTEPVPGHSVFGHSPSAHLATFAIAALMGFLRDRWRWPMLGLALAYAALSIPSYGLLDSLAIAVAAALLFAAPMVTIPRVLTKPIYVIAGASLFIYLLHFRFLQVITERLGFPVILSFAGAIAGGVVAWSLWNWGTKQIGEVWAKIAPILPSWPGKVPATQG